MKLNRGLKLQATLTFSPPVKRTILSENPELGFRKGQGIKVAIIDSGINKEIQVADEVDFTGFGLADGIHNTHGTLVATIIKHLAPNADIINIKVCQQGLNIDWINIMKGLKYAKDSGAHIVNLSIGHYTERQCYGKCQKCREVQAFARNNNMIIVAAAGNKGPSEGTIHCPSVVPDVISVGMLDSGGHTVARISSRSKPGMVKPNILASGFVNRPGYREQNGTSFSTPVITGVLAACLPAYLGNEKRLIDLLYSSCTEIEGVPRHHQGFGKVDLKRLMEEINNETAANNTQRQNPS